MFRDIFVALLQERNVTTYRLSKDTKISNGLVTGWTQGNKIPSGENLIKIADYFDISIDFLLGRTDKPEVNR